MEEQQLVHTEELPGFEGLGVPSGPAMDLSPDSVPAHDAVVGMAEDVLHPEATGVRRPRATTLSVPTGTPVVILVSTGPAEGALPSVAMPDLRTMGIESATRKAAKVGLVLQASPTYAKGIGANRVAVQYPEPGTRLQAGATVSVLISNGRRPPKGLVTHLPELVGSPAADAENSVFSAGLRPIIVRTPHPTAHPETVFAQLPNAHTVAKADHSSIARYLMFAVAAVVVTLALTTVVALYVASAR